MKALQLITTSNPNQSFTLLDDCIFPSNARNHHEILIERNSFECKPNKPQLLKKTNIDAITTKSKRHLGMFLLHLYIFLQYISDHFALISHLKKPHCQRPVHSILLREVEDCLDLRAKTGPKRRLYSAVNSLTSGDDVVRGTLRAQALKDIWTLSGRLRMRAKMKIHDNSADVFLFSDGFFRDLQDAESRSFFVILNTRYCALQLFSLSNCGVVIREFGQFDLKLLLSMCRAIW